jgi:hypothetical protein
MNLGDQSSQISHQLWRYFSSLESMGYLVIAQIGKGNVMKLILLEKQIEEICGDDRERWDIDLDIR